MSYRVKEVFPTIQGEGANQGTPALFVRMSGCNLWSGREMDRTRDSVRHRAPCAEWCDTDFADGKKYDLDELMAELCKTVIESFGDRPPLIVFTGGEPLLQMDVELVEAVRDQWAGIRIAVETNGTVKFQVGVRKYVDWVCMSPKVPPERIALWDANELKVVYPAFDPLLYEEHAKCIPRWSVQPQAIPWVQLGARPSATQVEGLHTGHIQAAIDFCIAHPKWSLSFQLHKVLNVR